MKLEKWLYKLEWKYGKYAVHGLMNIIITGMVIVYVMDNFICPMAGKEAISPLIVFSRDAIMHGQVWRIISFIFIPFQTTPIFLIFTFYFYWLIGQIMESNWGTFKFNIFYLSGIIGTIIGGFITGFTSNYFLTFSLFIAFALIAPDFQMLLFFFIPIKIKYLAMLDAVFMIISFFYSGLPGKVAIIMSLINLAIFFGGDFRQRMKMKIHHWKYKIKYKIQKTK